MTHAIALALPGAVLALAATVFIAALLPSRPALAAALDRLGTSAAPAEPSPPARWDVRVGTWVHAHLPDLPVFAPPATDLRLVGVTPSTFFRDKALLAALGLIAPSVFGIVMNALGLLPALVPVALGPILAAALWFAPDRDVRVRARAARTEFARAVAVYLELVAVERKRGAPAGQALVTTSEVGSTWVFARIREELTRARLAGVAPWTALGGLADEIGVPELADVAKIVRLSGEEGASVAESLRGRGRTLRGQLLADEHAKANQASERMSVPLTLLAFVFVGVVLTPLVLNLLA
ncbi:hypothetical protein GCM10011490_18030 [Pseudoclavibacter endophyticus]|uniref:TadC protein n=1 Tax=Pseudoclavibacter endophyticus TaxID=1778590 RepID=A0A6H9WD74_9MICO|nr:type II secretion system F family protein [Pseudoclavibacter endophyticus]KAB1648849.1 TadC protein [Pseudoclavibacter endophyticus]GGA67836.1 hypothetical protein GCM10011490_18030 [Pseudoclavibacter endophyticus]